jgi:CzcA family heavy metal efflux pump
MIDRIIAWSLQNRLIVLSGVALVLGTGLYAALTLPVDVFPDLTAPTVTVLTEAHGMAPEEVETLITFPIETTVNGAAGVRRVRSSTAQGISIVWVEFDWGQDIFRARQIVSEKLQLVAGQLPDGTGPPVLAPITSIMGEIYLVGITSTTQSLMELRALADWTIRKRLLAIDGIAQVVPIGGEVREYQVLVDPNRLVAHRVSLHEVLRAAAESNAVASGGVFPKTGEEVLIRGLGRVHSVEDIAQTVVAMRGDVPVTIADVATVQIGPKPRFGAGSVNAEAATILTLQKQPNANTLDLTRRIDEELARIQASLPEGTVLETDIFRQSDFISLAIDNVVAALRDGALLVIVILFLFLWNFRTTAISVVSIPLSLAVALITMRMAGVTINTMTLGGMAIAIGALVDDAIIGVENVFQRLRADRSAPPGDKRRPLDVVYEASAEIRGPIVSATLIISVVFIPLFFLSGVEGRMLAPLGFAYIVSIMASLAVAVTATPVLCSLLLPGAPVTKRERESWLVEWLKARYGSVLAFTMRRSRTILSLAGISVVAAVAVLPLLGRGFLPDFQEGTLTLSVITVPGTNIEESDLIGTLIEERLLAYPAVISTARRTGRAELDEHAQNVNGAEIDVQLDLSEIPLETAMEELRRQLTIIPGTTVIFGQPIGHRIDHMLSGTRAAIAVKLFGPDLYELRRVADTIHGLIQDVPGLVDLSVEQQADVPQLLVQPKRAAMARYGVTPGQLAEEIDVGFKGEVVSQVLESQQAFDLAVRFAPEHRTEIGRIEQALFDTPLGGKVPLSLLADVKLERGPNIISREDVQRKIVVQANVSGRDVGSAVDEIRQRLTSDLVLPEGYFVEYGGQFESGLSAIRAITLLSVLSFFAIFIILYRQFGNTRTSMLLMVNVPLALIGGVFAVLLAGGVLNVASLVGFITLFGIAVRNGILLVSRYQTLLNEGQSLTDAITRGSLERLSPILMTAVTAGLALIPLALGGGEAGKEIQSPMAIVILGGLVTSTALNMVVVPALFKTLGRRGLRQG